MSLLCSPWILLVEESIHRFSMQFISIAYNFALLSNPSTCISAVCNMTLRSRHFVTFTICFGGRLLACFMYLEQSVHLRLVMTGYRS